MEGRFKCCDKKFNSLYCVICENLFHRSCCERKKEVTAINNHKIYCSINCAEKAKSKHDEQIEMLNQIIKELKQELESRDTYIRNLRRKSEAFESDVIEFEQCYNKEIEVQKTTIKNLQKTLESEYMKNKKETVNTSSQTIAHRTSEKYTQVNQKLHNSVGIQVQTIVKTDNSKKDTRTLRRENDKKNSILILGDSNATEFSKILSHLLGDDYIITSYVKHNAMFGEIIGDIQNLTKNFTKKDYVIIMGGSVDALKGSLPKPLDINKLKSVSNYTNLVLFSVPLWKNRIVLNNYINEFNKTIYYELIVNLNKDRVLFININSIINYTKFIFRRGSSIKYSGKRKLLETVSELINNKNGMHRHNNIQSQNGNESTLELESLFAIPLEETHTETRRSNIPLNSELRDALQSEQITDNRILSKNLNNSNNSFL